MEKFVYIVRTPGGFYKVGVAQNVRQRIAELQTGNPHRIELVAARSVSLANELEKRLHKFLVNHKSGGGTEWFKLADDRVIEAVVMLFDGTSASTVTNDIMDEEGMALRIFEEVGYVSISILQRRLSIGWSRAARIVDSLEAQGYVGKNYGTSKGRELLKSS